MVPGTSGGILGLPYGPIYGKLHAWAFWKLNNHVSTFLYGRIARKPQKKSIFSPSGFF